MPLTETTYSSSFKTPWTFSTKQHNSTHFDDTANKKLYGFESFTSTLNNKVLVIIFKNFRVDDLCEVAGVLVAVRTYGYQMKEGDILYLHTLLPNALDVG